ATHSLHGAPRRRVDRTPGRNANPASAAAATPLAAAEPLSAPEAPAAPLQAPTATTLAAPSTAAKLPANPRSEAALLRQARELLPVDPARALELTRQDEREFPNGQLAQERETIAIEALERSGRTDEARARARAFEARFPDSVHLRKVDPSSGR